MPSKVCQAVAAHLAGQGWAVSGSDPRNPWFSWTYLHDNRETLLAALWEHLSLTVVSVVLAALVALPLAVLAYQVDWLAGPLISLSGVLYTIPSLALFAFLAPFLGLKPITVVVGLVMYALLIILRGGLTGLRQVSTEVREVAQGMGYGPLAMLWRVELPLALPSILTSLRVATVSTVALVTVGYLVGYGGFGTLILSGFYNNFYKTQIMAATVGCVGLAAVLDLMLMGLGRLLTPWKSRSPA